MSERRKRIAAVFGAALLARLLFLFAGDQPLLYTHQYTYFTNALRIAEHEQPLRYLVASDEWRTWDQHWTIAPLYFVFVAGLFKLPTIVLVATSQDAPGSFAISVWIP